jgi:hypothetical protein
MEKLQELKKKKIDVNIFSTKKNKFKCSHMRITSKENSRLCVTGTEPAPTGSWLSFVVTPSISEKYKEGGESQC